MEYRSSEVLGKKEEQSNEISPLLHDFGSNQSRIEDVDEETPGCLDGILGLLSSCFSCFGGGDEHDQALTGRLEENDFRVSAGLNEYKSGMPKGFEESTGKLGKDDRWLDGGAGEANVMRDRLKKGDVPEMVALGYAMPKGKGIEEDVEDSGGKFKYVSGKFFAQCGEEELGTKAFKLITDFNGVLLYTETLSQDLQKYLDLLEVGGELYAYNLGSITIEGYGSASDWLAAITGADVTTDGSAIKIVKTEEKCVVPPLELMGGDFGHQPPVRNFSRL